MKKVDFALLLSLSLVSSCLTYNSSNGGNLLDEPKEQCQPIENIYSNNTNADVAIPIYSFDAINIRLTSQYRRSLREYRKSHSICEWCQNKDIEIHHIIPVHINTNIAADTNNMVALCRNCHFVIGHACNWNRKWVVNLKEIVKIRKIGEDIDSK